MQLYEHQIANLKKFLSLKCSIDMSETRTGKGETCIGLIKNRDPNKTILISPNGIVFNEWLQKLKILEKYGYHICNFYDNPTLENLPFKSIIVLTFGTLKSVNGTKIAHMIHDKFKLIDLLIIDEMHYFKNYKSLTAKNIKIIAKRAYYKHLCSATPIVNDLSEMYSYLNLLFPMQFRSYWSFVDRYFITYTMRIRERRIKKVARVKEQFKQELIDTISSMSAKTYRKDVYDVLPQIINERISIKTTPQQLKYYELLKNEKEFVSPNGEKIDCWNEASALTMLIKFRQISVCGDIFGIKNNRTSTLIEWAKYSNGRLIIFSSFTKYLLILQEKMKKEGINSYLYTGEQNQKQKLAAETAFKKQDDAILLANVNALSTGATLDMCDTIIFNDLPQSYTVYNQAKDRITPPIANQSDTMKKIIILENDLGIDQSSYDLIINKKKSFSVINDYKLYI